MGSNPTECISLAQGPFLFVCVIEVIEVIEIIEVIERLKDNYLLSMECSCI